MRLMEGQYWKQLWLFCCSFRTAAPKAAKKSGHALQQHGEPYSADVLLLLRLLGARPGNYRAAMRTMAKAFCPFQYGCVAFVESCMFWFPHHERQYRMCVYIYVYNILCAICSALHIVYSKYL